MNHALYAYSGADNMMVLLDRNQDIAGDIAAQAIDDFLAIPSSPDMFDKCDLHDVLFRYTH